MLPLSAFAQQSTTASATGPIIIQQQRLPEEQIHFEPPQLTLDMSAAYTQSRSRTAGVDESFNQTILQQILEARTRGYIIHPNIVELSLAGSFGLQEVFSSGDGGSSQTIGTIYDWDVSALILRNSEWPMQVYSQRQEAWVFREFGPAIRTDSTATGFDVSHRVGSTFHNLSLAHVETNQDLGDDVPTLSIVQDRLSYYGAAAISANQSLDWSYNFSRIEETGGVDYTYQTQDLSLAHVARFGNNNRSSLTSSFAYSEQTGDSEYQRFRFNEHLYLWHSREFQTRYDYTYTQFNVGDVDRSNHRLTAGFTHLLYKSLTTTGNAGVQYSTGSEDYTLTQQFADISWAYRKQVPLGALSAHLGLGWDHAESDSGSSAIRMIDQGATFNDPMPIVITGTNIDPSTIILTDPSGMLYLPGQDYTVTGFPDRVEIQRIVGGNIGSGQAVLIDFTRGAEAANSTTTTSFNTGTRYDFEKGPLKGLALYARYAQQDQSIDTESSQTLAPNEYRDTIYGTEYKFGHFTVGAEQQLHDSSTYPYDATRIWGRYLRRAGDTNWSLNAAYTTIDYSDADYGTTLYTISARVEHRFNTRLTGSATIMWRNEDNELYGRTTGFDEQLELTWRYRQLEAYFQVRASQLDREEEQTQYEFFRIGVRRQF